MNTVTCRYNTNHKLKLAKLPQHEEKCPDRFGKDIKPCPYNIYHKIESNKLDQHKKECPNRPNTINTDIENELKEYLSKQNKKYQPILQKSEPKKIPGVQLKVDKTQEKKILKIIKKSEEFENANLEIIDEEYVFENKTEESDPSLYFDNIKI